MKIHELAHLSGVNPETIRMYRQKGLLHPARLANGYFDYSACNLYELMFVRKLRGANLGLETIASFYAEDGQAGALRNMKQEIRALEEAIRELEQRKKQLMSTLGHYVLFSNQPQQVQELTLRSECWFVPLELEPADSVCRRWMEHADALFTGIRIDPAYLEQPTQQVPYTMELGAYTEDLKRLKLPLPPQARRMPGGTYLSSFLEAETDGTLRGGQLQPVIDYAAAHHYRFCPEQGAFLYCLMVGRKHCSWCSAFRSGWNRKTDKTKAPPAGNALCGRRCRFRSGNGRSAYRAK